MENRKVGNSLGNFINSTRNCVYSKFLFCSYQENTLETPLPVFQLPGAKERGNVGDRVCGSLVFASQSFAVVSAGNAQLLLLETFDRSQSLMWKVRLRFPYYIQFKNLFEIYKRLLFSVHILLNWKQTKRVQCIRFACFTQSSVALEAFPPSRVCCSTSIRVLTTSRLRLSSSGSPLQQVYTFPSNPWSVQAFSCLLDETSGAWNLVSRRKFTSDVTPHYAVIEADNGALRIASEKPLKLVFDSEKPLQSETAQADVEEAQNDEAEGFLSFQTRLKRDQLC